LVLALDFPCQLDSSNLIQLLPPFFSTAITENFLVAVLILGHDEKDQIAFASLLLAADRL